MSNTEYGIVCGMTRPMLCISTTFVLALILASAVGCTTDEAQKVPSASAPESPSVANVNSQEGGSTVGPATSAQKSTAYPPSNRTDGPSSRSVGEVSLAEKGPSKRGEVSREQSGDVKQIESRAEACEAARVNVLRLEAGENGPKQNVMLLKAKSQDFDRQCAGFSPALVQCLVAAKSVSDLGDCKFENEKSVRPNPALMSLCDAAYKNARNLIVAAGAPGPALARFDERRPEALIQCTREPRSVVECLVSAASMVEMRACRDSVDGTVPEVPPAISRRCRNIFERVFGNGDVPEFFQKKWGSQPEAFILECARMPEAMRECMLGAKRFSDFQTCAKKGSAQTPQQPQKAGTQ